MIHRTACFVAAFASGATAAVGLHAGLAQDPRTSASCVFAALLCAAVARHEYQTAAEAHAVAVRLERAVRVRPHRNVGDEPVFRWCCEPWWLTRGLEPAGDCRSGHEP